jgi:hypothetical protein
MRSIQSVRQQTGVFIVWLFDDRRHDTGSNWKPPDRSATKYTPRFKTQMGYAILKLNKGENETVSTDNWHAAGVGVLSAV